VPRGRFFCPADRKRKVKSLTSEEVSYIKSTAKAGPSSAKSASVGVTTLRKNNARGGFEAGCRAVL